MTCPCCGGGQCVEIHSDDFEAARDMADAAWNAATDEAGNVNAAVLGLLGALILKRLAIRMLIGSDNVATFAGQWTEIARVCIQRRRAQAAEARTEMN